MSRIVVATLIITVTILLFHFAGIIPDGTPTGFVLGKLGLIHPENFDSTAFYKIIIGLGALGIGGVTISLFASKSLETAIFYGVGILLVPFLLSMILDLILIFGLLSQFNNFLAVIVIAPLLVVWLVSIYDWVRGIG